MTDLNSSLLIPPASSSSSAWIAKQYFLFRSFNTCCSLLNWAIYRHLSLIILSRHILVASSTVHTPACLRKEQLLWSRNCDQSTVSVHGSLSYVFASALYFLIFMSWARFFCSFDNVVLLIFYFILVAAGHVTTQNLGGRKICGRVGQQSFLLSQRQIY